MIFEKFLKNIKEENKIFYTFLAIHLIVWTCISLIRVVLPTDSLEGIYWGSLMDFGTHKHPPLAGWLTYFVFIPFKSDFCVYLLSQLFIVTGFVFIYKLAQKFLDDSSAMLSVIILEGCWCYSYVTSYYGFNPDVILLCTLPIISYCFYNCMKEDSLCNWVKLGIIVGISFLGKYQTAFLILPMAVWAFLFKRETFKNKYFYLSILIAFLIFLPHLLWLIKYDFFIFGYFDEELTARTWFSHISTPLIFLLMQIVAIAGSLIIFCLLKLVFKSPFKLRENYNKEDLWFILLLGLLPIVMHLVMGFCSGGTMRPRWGYEFWFMTGIMLFYLFPINITKKEFLFTVKSAYIVMTIVFLVLGTLYAVEKNYRSRYPVSVLTNYFKKVLSEKYNMELKYVGGYLEWSIPITVYDENHPVNLLDTYGYKNPWLDENDLKKSGAILIDRTSEGVINYTKKTVPHLSEDYKIEPIEYKFFVHNALKMPREYTIYFVIVPPMK